MMGTWEGCGVQSMGEPICKCEVIMKKTTQPCTQLSWMFSEFVLPFDNFHMTFLFLLIDEKWGKLGKPWTTQVSLECLKPSGTASTLPHIYIQTGPKDACLTTEIGIPKVYVKSMHPFLIHWRGFEYLTVLLLRNVTAT